MKRKIFTLIIMVCLSLTLFSANEQTPLTYNQIPYPAKVKIALINANKMAYIDEGRGDVLVFIHGLSTVLTNYTFQINHYKKKYRVIAMDLIGNGRSDKPNINYTINSRADSVISLLKQLKIKNAVFIGHSNGGHIAANIAVRYPEFVKKLVLIAPGGMVKISPHMIEQLKTGIDNWFETIEMEGPEYVKKLVYKWNDFWENAIKISKRLRLSPDHKLIMKAAKLNVYDALKMQTTMPDKYKNIKVPVLFVLGKHDILVPSRSMTLESFTDYLKKIFVNPKINVMETGHMVQMEEPQEFNKILDNFLK